MTARWAVLSASTTGGAHARAGISSQDAYAVREVDGVLVLVVADGAGCARLAGAGAALAVSFAVREMVDLLRAGRPRDGAAWRALLRTGSLRAVRRFRRATVAVARGARGLRTGDLATTLTIVLASPPWLAAFAVGDGFIVLRTGAERHDLVLSPPGGADRPLGGTALLTSARVMATARRLVAHVPDLTGVAVGSDGLDPLLVERAEALPVRPRATVFERLFALVEDPETDAMRLTQTLTGRQVCRLTDDDRTLVLAVPR